MLILKEGFAMCLHDSDLKCLSLFNRRVDELRSSGFARWASKWSSEDGEPLLDIYAVSNKPMQITEKLSEDGRNLYNCQMDLGKSMKVNWLGPDKDIIRSFVSIIRLFMGEHERSITEISRAYKNLPEERKENQDFRKLSKEYHKLIKSTSTVCENGKYLSKEEVIKSAIYGLLIHEDEEQMDRCNSWMSMQYLAPFYWAEFITILVEVYNILLRMQELNKSLLSNAK